MPDRTPTDTLYYERANGRWEAWTVTDGQRVYLLRAADENTVRAYARRHGYHALDIS